MMILHIYHDDNGRKLMVQGLYYTYRVVGLFYYGICQDFMAQVFMVWLWLRFQKGLWFDYVCGMFHKGLWFDYGYGMFHKCLWHGYGCAMFHRCYDFGCGMFCQGWLARGVVVAAPSLVTQLSGAPCGNSLTSLCSLNLLTCLNLAFSMYGFFRGFGSWRMVGGLLHMFACRRRAPSRRSEFLLVHSWDVEDGWTDRAQDWYRLSGSYRFWVRCFNYISRSSCDGWGDKIIKEWKHMDTNLMCVCRWTWRMSMEPSMLHGYHSFLVIMFSFVYKSKVMMFDSRLIPPVVFC